MASSYCDISFSWQSERSPTSVTTYSFTDVTSDETYDDDSRPNTYSSGGISLTRKEDDTTEENNCILYLSCPNPDFACINGIWIISESRTLEISNDTDGYIMTIRGKKITDSSSFPEQTDDTTSNLYSCRCFFEESYSSLSVKFVSLGNSTSFLLQSLVINISQQRENSVQPRGTFNIHKLKKDVDEMGEAVSDKAKDFLTTLEQYEENKLASLGGLVGSHNPSIGQQQWASSGQGLSSIMNNILGAGAMKSLLKSEDSNGEGPDMYKMLQAVCGSVTSMRAVSAQQKEDSSATASPPDSGIEDHSKDSDVDEAYAHQLDMMLTLIDQKIDQAKSDLHKEFIEFKTEVTEKLDESTKQMNEKLDIIMNMLSDLTNRQKALHSEVVTSETTS